LCNPGSDGGFPQPYFLIRFSRIALNQPCGFNPRIAIEGSRYIWRLNEVKYVGRTRQELKARKMQHWKADKLKNGLEIQIADFKGKSLTGLSYAEARGLEHMVYKSYIDDGAKLLNRIRPLNVEAKGIKALTVKGYQDAAEAFLKVFRAIP
jgi:hypothetical protein